MERSFAKEVEALRLGAGETFRGEGILAVTKALLQSGVAYVGGYQGAPVSHLLDVMVEAKDLLGELGVHVETCTNEASAAAMLGASINYPLRGAVTWKSIVGTNVAADALSNLASPGVVGGALIIIGEDYGEGASVIQERSYAYAMKSTMWLLDPRPELPAIVRMVEKGFELSEASNTPVMLELRIRACHVTGEFLAKDNVRPRYSSLDPLSGPPRFDYARLAHPPLTYVQERLKVEQRLPAACAFIQREGLNEFEYSDIADIGIIVLGGLYNGVTRALDRLGLTGEHGRSRIPMYVMNVAYPVVPEEVRTFCASKRAVLVVEEGNPDYVEQAVNVELRRADLNAVVHGKDCLPRAGEYVSDVMVQGLAAFIEKTAPMGIDTLSIAERAREIGGKKAAALAALGDLPPRPPAFCTGCPERPVFSALKLVQRELGPTHISADIGCHSFATFAPFSMGNSILGYGMSLASAAAVAPNLSARPIAVMGDGGFWHNGLITGVASNLFNRNDGVLIVMQNGYTSATGQQYMPSSAGSPAGPAPGMDIETTLRAMGVKWLRKVRSYSVAAMSKTLKEAMRTAERGLKVIIADGECQLARQRRVRSENAEKLKRGERVVTTRFGVDDAICTGDHSCIRLSGCPSLSVKPSPDPLRSDPVATVVESCVGCGLCGEVAHAATLCPSFYRAEVTRNPGLWERWQARVRRRVIAWLDGSNREAPERGAAALPQARTATPSVPELAPSPTSATLERPLKILIAALGGEGGGVLTQWIVNAASALGYAVQSTSIPGVAQRTGATTYYIEIAPQGERPPVLALSPGVGDVDIVLASELMEAGRTIAGGFVTPERTLLIASEHRSYLVTEKMAMGDGRYDSERLKQVAAESANDLILLDMEAIARSERTMINAVMLGALAGSGRLSLPVEVLENAIRADGKAVDSNICGLRAGLEAANAARPASPTPDARRPVPVAVTDDLRIAQFPAAARDVITLGMQRLAGYQDASYAALYLQRLLPIDQADWQTAAGGLLVRETARHLAVRMSYEDVIRVAQAKTDKARREEIALAQGASAAAPVTITEFLKPGISEFCSILPPSLARRILRIAERRGWKEKLQWPMEVRTTSVSGYLRFRFLAGLRRWRPRTYRYREEQAAIESWLDLILAAAHRGAQAALEVAECARLIKGYGDTHERGIANYRRIEAEVIRPLLASGASARLLADAIASARAAALADPEGETLGRCIAQITEHRALAVAAE